MSPIFPPTTLPIGALAGVFNDTVSSYKFLMMRSILDLSTSKTRISMNEIALRSISYAWYTINFYKLSYGPSDSMGKWIEKLGTQLSSKGYEFIISDLSYEKIHQVLKILIEDKNESVVLKEIIRDFKKYVPYRLLSPWFANELRGRPENEKNKLILELSHQEQFKSLYILEQDQDDLYININPKWSSYINENITFIDSWWKWNFVNFLQTRNPTALGLVKKLQPPMERDMAAVKSIFKGYFSENSLPAQCFFSGEPLIGQSISHDHFMPWSFLGSDLIFNFVPCTKSINSAKSNCIPAKSYLTELASFQFKMFDWLKKKENKALEEYISELSLPIDSSRELFKQNFHSFYEPLYLTAKNQRFSMEWVWKKD